MQTAIICGGGSLAPHLDDFFEALGLPVLNGWGLSETSPVVACRRIDAADAPERNVRGTVGRPIPGTRLKCAPWLTLARRHSAVLAVWPLQGRQPVSAFVLYRAAELGGCGRGRGLTRRAVAAGWLTQSA